MINRAVLILRYKQPFVDWINAAGPNPSHRITLDEANEDISSMCRTKGNSRNGSTGTA